MTAQTKPHFKKRIHYAFFSVIIFLSFLLVMEGGIRLFFYIKNRLAGYERSFSHDLGWVTESNVAWQRDVKGYGEIKYSTGPYGFRVFGDVHTDKTKVLVIGDSYTEGHTVSDGRTYYEVLEKETGAMEVFAYGGGGYGTLQEFMILDRYIDEIKPDLILWQFSGNDIINNSHALESASFKNNNQMTRPYYEDGRIEWLFPTQYRGCLDKALQSSYLLRLFNVKLNIFAAEHIGSIEDEWSPEHPLYRKSIEITTELMRRVKNRAGKAPVIAFSVDVEGLFEKICRKSDIEFIRGVGSAVREAKSSGLTVDGTPYDAHWNHVGHAIAGKVIYRYIDEHHHLNRKASKPESQS